MPGRHAPAEVRFWRHVAKSDGCWHWTGSIRDTGYGQFKTDARRPPVKAHRYSYEAHYGPIPAGLMVCHRCDNPPCVRPDHLFLGDAAQNAADMLAKGRGSMQGANGVERIQEVAQRVRRLTDRQLREALGRAAHGESSRSIARSMDCSHTTISRLVRGDHWASLSASPTRHA